MLPKIPTRLQLFASAAFLFLSLGACSNPQSDFTNGLSLDPCDSNYPACNTEVGCILTNSSYIQGTFPDGTQQFIVQLTAPSNVELDIFLINPTGSGTSTTITWNEAGCTSTFQDCILGTTFTGTAEAAGGTFTASQQLVSPGDHLIQFNSDANAQYLVKAIVTPIGLGVTPATDGEDSQCQ